MRNHLLRSALLFTFLLVAGAPLTAQVPGWTSYANSNPVIAAVNSGDTLWLGTAGGGLVRFIQSSRQSTIFNRANSGISDNWITALAVDSSRHLWIGTRRGLASFDGNSWMIYDTVKKNVPAPPIVSIAVGKQGEIWAASHEGLFFASSGLIRFKDGTWSFYRTADTTFPSDQVASVAVARDGTVWAATRDKGLISFDGTTPKGYAAGGFRYVAASPDADDIWAISISLNVVHRSHDGAAPVPLTTSNTDGNDIFSARTIHAENGEVVVGFYGGIASFDGTKFQQRSIPQLTGTVQAVESGAGGTLWVGIDSGIVEVTAGNQATIHPLSETGLPTNATRSLLADGSSIWIGLGTNTGVARFDGTAWQVFNRTTPGFPAGDVTSIAKDSSGNIWVATAAGIARFDGITWKTFLRDSIYGASIRLCSHGPGG